MVKRLIKSASLDMVFLATMTVILPIVFYITWAFGGAVGVIILMFIALVATSRVCYLLAARLKGWADE